MCTSHDHQSNASFETIGTLDEVPCTRLQPVTNESANMIACGIGVHNYAASSSEQAFDGRGQCPHSRAKDVVEDISIAESKDCHGCGMKYYHLPKFWTCAVCLGYLLCDNCYIAQSICMARASSEIGIDHMIPNLVTSTCDCCGSQPILKRRWACQVCQELDLCETCYNEVSQAQMPLGHSISHPMHAIEVISEKWMKSERQKPKFAKPIDPQWAYHIHDSRRSGYDWKRRDLIVDLFRSQQKDIEVGDEALQCWNVASTKENQIDNIKSSWQLDPKCKIFMSHAGSQKGFVEHLDAGLRKVHQFGIFFDKDDDSLPKGEPFPERIFEAAKQCEFAIVVMSDDYFTRKWPMLELLAFVEAQKTRPSLKILPIFYEISMEEFKQLDRREKFLNSWKGHMSTLLEDDERLWNKAMRTISISNGIHYDSKKGELALIDEIIDVVCKRVVPDLEFEVTDVQGRRRLSEMIQGNLQESNGGSNEKAPTSVSYVGLYGMGGMGKTTLSKVVCNNMRQQFLGKVCHLELDTKDALGLRKQLLLETTNLDASFVDSKASDERKALTLLNKHIPQQKIFLVLDNDIDKLESIQEVKTYLKDIPFKEGSIVLVTARSCDLLQKLNMEWRVCMRIPCLRIHEAMALFIRNTGCNTSVFSNEAKRAINMGVKYCSFDVGDTKGQEYHPLALKVLGGYYGCDHEEWQDIANNLDLKHSINEDRHPIFKILRTSYDTLSTKKKRMFLHIAATNDHGLWWDDVLVKFQTLYNEVNVDMFHSFLKELKAKSLVESFTSNRIIYIHDLYCEFAQLEMESNGLRHNRDCILYSRENPGHYQERSLLICDVSSSSIRTSFDHLVAKDMSCKCFQSEVLMIENCPNLLSASFEGLKHLEVLSIKKCPQLRHIHIDGAKKLWSIRCEDYVGEYPSLKDLWSLQNLLFGFNEEARDGDFNRPLDLSGCPNLLVLRLLDHVHLRKLPNFNCVQQLKFLTLHDCHHLEKFVCLEVLSSIQCMRLWNCSSLLEFPLLQKFVHLKDFTLEGAIPLQSISTFANLVGLNTLVLRNGRLLKELPGISMCTKLNHLDLENTDIDDFSWISNMKELQFIKLSGTKFIELPNWNQLHKLEELNLRNCLALQSLDNLGALPTLQVLDTIDSKNLKSLPILSTFPSLRVLNVNGTSVENVFSVELCVHLEQLGVARTRITSLPDLSYLLNLKILDASGCCLLTRLDNIKRLPSLEHFYVHDCMSLVALPDLCQSKNFLGSLSLTNTPLVDPNFVKLPTCGEVVASRSDTCNDIFRIVVDEEDPHVEMKVVGVVNNIDNNIQESQASSADHQEEEGHVQMLSITVDRQVKTWYFVAALVVMSTMFLSQKIMSKDS